MRRHDATAGGFMKRENIGCLLPVLLLGLRFSGKSLAFGTSSWSEVFPELGGRGVWVSWLDRVFGVRSNLHFLVQATIS